MSNKNSGAKLVYKEQSLNSNLVEPELENMTVDIQNVLKRSTEYPDLSIDMPVIENTLSDMDASLGTSTKYVVKNYLGRYKLSLTVTPLVDLDLNKIHNYALSELSKLFNLEYKFSRIVVSVTNSTGTCERFYIDSNNPSTIIFDKKYTEHLEVSPINNQVLSKISKLQNEYTDIIVTTEGYSTPEYDNISVVLSKDESTDLATFEDCCINFIDSAFMIVESEMKNPVNLQIYYSMDENSTLIFSGLIFQDAKLFDDFYTDMTYYQAISRAEYYLCNDWLYDFALDTISKTLNSIS